ncbi:MAG: rubrerythrin family protein [Haloarculaceae archaeon]
MDADDLTDAVRDDQKTELSRLGSSKSLYADTRGEMEPDAVRAAAAAREQAASDVFEAWADDADSDAADLFDEAATEAADRAGAIDAEPADWTPAVVEYLDERSGTVARLGGLVGWALADEKNKEQLTGYFTGQADPRTASTFRSAGSDVADLRERAGDLLESICEDESDWADAEEAAVGAVAAAYDEYFETLEDLGVNPKPVC